MPSRGWALIAGERARHRRNRACRGDIRADTQGEHHCALVNPTSPFITESISKDLQSATRALGLQLHILNASTERDFDTVFATFANCGRTCS